MTFIEMIGVLSVIAVLMSVLMPRVASTLEDAKLTAAVAAVNNTRQATETYFRQYGRFAGVGGASVTLNKNAYEYWDRKVLLAEQLVDHALESKIATKAYLRLVKLNTSSTADVISSANYGSLGSILCNNGIYDLTQQYSAATPTQEPEIGFASMAVDRNLSPDLAGVSVRPSPSMISQAVDTFLEEARTGKLGPMLGCYSVPWPNAVPPPGLNLASPGRGRAHTSRPPAHNDVNQGRIVVEAVLEGVSVVDAFRLSMAIDGPFQSNWAYWDSLGRVKYDFIKSFTGPVFIYIAHN